MPPQVPEPVGAGSAIPLPAGVFPSGEPGVSGDFWGSQEGFCRDLRELPMVPLRGEGSCGYLFGCTKP